jgi:hypothetical protein
MPPEDLRAARANPVFCADKKRIRTENRVLDKVKNGFGLFLSNSTTPQQSGVRFKEPRTKTNAARLSAAAACLRGDGDRYAVKNYFAGWLAYQDARPSIMALL